MAQGKITDILGRTIAAGDIIAYGMRSGDAGTLQLYLVDGTDEEKQQIIAVTCSTDLNETREKVPLLDDEGQPQYREYRGERTPLYHSWWDHKVKRVRLNAGKRAVIIDRATAYLSDERIRNIIDTPVGGTFTDHRYY